MVWFPRDISVYGHTNVIIPVGKSIIRVKEKKNKSEFGRLVVG